MARARNIKPSLFKNEILGTADPNITLTFISLWCLADREGRLEDRPLRIKAETFPYREDVTLPVFNGYLTELARLGFICRYYAKNTAIIQVENFTKHQSPHKTERASELPEWCVEDIVNTDVSGLTVNAPLKDDGLTEAKRPDSLLLIPDSLSKERTTNVVPKKPKVPPKFQVFPIPRADADEKLWTGYLESRAKMKKPLTELGYTNLQKDLAKLGDGFDLNRRLADAIDKKWQGLVFKDDMATSPTKPAYQPKTTADVNASRNANANKMIEELRRQADEERTGQKLLGDNNGINRQIAQTITTPGDERRGSV